MPPKPSPRAPAEPPPAPRTNLKAAVSPLVGRVADLQAIADRFEEGARLVTITGLGGLGKTSVATRFAEEQLAIYSAHGAGGVWLCDLTAARTSLAAAAAVASVLGVALCPSADEEEVQADLGSALARRKRVLVVLDNFEQLRASADRTVGRWMRAAPHARFLVTSRVALDVAGEHLWPLPPLALPGAASSDAGALAAAPAVDLFVRRARQVRPDLSPGAADLAGIADIVKRLDGIPLAIELAAARLRVLSIPQLRERLSRPLQLLVRAGDEGRHGSMRRAISDSYDQLSAAEKACLRGCAVFAGGFTLEAAEAVLGSEEAPVLPALEALCAHSLVRSVYSIDPGGEPRFFLFETIRELSAALLTGEERRALVERHRAHFAAASRAWAERAEAEGSSEALGHIGAEMENLLAAHAAAVLDGGPEAAADALRLALGAGPVLRLRGLFRASVRLLDEAIAAAFAPGCAASKAELSATFAPGCAVSPAELSAALLARGRAHRELGAIERARADLLHALAAARDASSALLEAQAETCLGEIVEIEGATAEARRCFTRALGRVAEAGGGAAQSSAEAEIRAHLAHAHRREGALAEAESEIRAAIALRRAAGHAEGLAMVLYEAAVVAMFQKRYDDAAGRFDEALAIVQKSGARRAEGALLSGIGVLLQERGHLAAALEHHARAVDVFRELGSVHREASALYYLAGAYLERGLRDDAATLLGRALALVRTVGARRYEALMEACRAALLAGGGDLEGAAAALASAERSAASCRSETTLVATLAIHRLHVEARAGTRDRAALLAEARAIAGAHASDDPRFALRVFESSMAPAGTANGPPRAAGEPLSIRSGGRAFRLPGAPSDVDLSRRAPLRRILFALARRRVDSPGEWLDLEEVLAAGWPGERVQSSAGANRVYVAISTLRKLGLRDLLVAGPGGYALHPAGLFRLEE